MNDITTKQKLAIAKLLPERIFANNLIGSGDEHRTIFTWDKPFSFTQDNRIVLDTEWLQIVQWVEEGLTDEQWYRYWANLVTICWRKGNKHREEIVATTSQRLAALEAAGIINTKE